MATQQWSKAGSRTFQGFDYAIRDAEKLLAHFDSIDHQDLQQFHHPNPEKTKKISIDYTGVDVTVRSTWANYDPEKARATLNGWIVKRGRGNGSRVGSICRTP